MDNAIIIFIKNPELGKVKTRLAATVGSERALGIYQQLIALTLKAVKHINADKFIYFSDMTDSSISFMDVAFYQVVQHGKDLGERMEHAFTDVFKKLYRNIVIIGTDCPGIDSAILETAFLKLSSSDVVIGPATDGGYYLLGMSKECPMLFRNIEWSTSTVLQKTIAFCNDNAIGYSLLTELSDVDEEKDLIHLEQILKLDLA